jgi:hypothetical protein
MNLVGGGGCLINNMLPGNSLYVLVENRMLECPLSFVDQVTFYKNIFHVMYCADHCVHSARGASMPILGGATPVGIRYCQFFSVVEQIFD